MYRNFGEKEGLMKKNTLIYEGTEMKYCNTDKQKTWFELFTIIRPDGSKLRQIWLCSWCNREYQNPNKKEV